MRIPLQAGVVEADFLQHRFNPGKSLFRGQLRRVYEQLFRDDSLHIHLWVKRTHRVLKNELQVTAYFRRPRLHRTFKHGAAK